MLKKYSNKAQISLDAILKNLSMLKWVIMLSTIIQRQAELLDQVSYNCLVGNVL